MGNLIFFSRMNHSALWSETIYCSKTKILSPIFEEGFYKVFGSILFFPFLALQWTSLNLITKAICGRLHSNGAVMHFISSVPTLNKDFAADQTPISRVG